MLMYVCNYLSMSYSLVFTDAFNSLKERIDSNGSERQFIDQHKLKLLIESIHIYTYIHIKLDKSLRRIYGRNNEGFIS